MTRDCEYVMRDTSHITSDVLSSVIDPGITQRKKCSLNQLANTEGHKASILCSHPELEMVEEIDIFEERASVRKDLANSSPFEAVDQVNVDIHGFDNSENTVRTTVR